MPTVNEIIFSEYDVKCLNFILGTGEKKQVWPVKVIGKLEEESEVRKLIKKGRGVTIKNRTWGTGAGTLKLTAHMPYDLYILLHGMDADDLAEGVHAYGRDSRHPEAVVTGDVYDEDDVEKFKAWPSCVVSTGPARSIENGAEEVAETELEIGFSPDAAGRGMYEALANTLSDDIKTAWMESFGADLVKKTPTV